MLSEVPPTLTADLAFRQAANQAATYFSAPPPYVRYDVKTDVVVRSFHREKHFTKTVILRTNDDKAIITDAGRDGTSVSDHPYPCTPFLDPISNFYIAYGMTISGAVHFSLTNIQPLHFAAPHVSDADVVVSGSREYIVRYAPDSDASPNGRTHITFKPYQHFLAELPKNDFYFRDLVIDNATGLPSEFSFTGANDLALEFHYRTEQGHVVLSTAHFEQTMNGPFHVGRVHFISDATFDNYTFSNAPLTAALDGANGAVTQAAAVPTTSPTHQPPGSTLDPTGGW